MATIDSSTQPPLTAYEGSCNGSDGTDDGRAIREVLDRVGDKWSLLVVGTLRERRLRFTELQRHIPGISQRMLTLTVRQLERDGLITRTVYAEVPPRVEYELTELGDDTDRARHRTRQLGDRQSRADRGREGCVRRGTVRVGEADANTPPESGTPLRSGPSPGCRVP